MDPLNGPRVPGDEGHLVQPMIGSSMQPIPGYNLLADTSIDAQCRISVIRYLSLGPFPRWCLGVPCILLQSYIYKKVKIFKILIMAWLNKNYTICHSKLSPLSRGPEWPQKALQIGPQSSSTINHKHYYSTQALQGTATMNLWNTQKYPYWYQTHLHLTKHK